MAENAHFLADVQDQLAAVPPDSILSRKMLDAEGVGVTLFAFAPGQELSEHTASRPAILHFIEGKGTLQLGEEQHPIGAGSWAYMPAHLPHAVFAESQTIMLLYLLGE